MKFLIDRLAFRDALQRVEMAIDRKPTRPVLGGVVVQADNNSLIVLASDLDISVRYRIDQVQVDEPGWALVPGRELVDVFKDIEADIVPELRVRYAHEFGDTARPLAGRFADAATPAPFSVEAAEIGRDVAILGAGWTVVGEGSSSLSLHYDVTLNEDILAHAISLGILIYW